MSRAALAGVCGGVGGRAFRRVLRDAPDPVARTAGRVSRWCSSRGSGGCWGRRSPTTGRLAGWRSVVIVAPRKNGKTPTLGGARALPAAHVGGAARRSCSRRRRTRSGGPAVRRGRPVRSPLARSCRELLRVRDHAGEIVREDGLGVDLPAFVRPARLYGYNPTLRRRRRVRVWTTPNLRRAYAALTSGGGARSAPQMFTITTAGEASQRHDSILGRSSTPPWTPTTSSGSRG